MEDAGMDVGSRVPGAADDDAPGTLLPTPEPPSLPVELFVDASEDGYLILTTKTVSHQPGFVKKRSLCAQ